MKKYLYFILVSFYPLVSFSQSVEVIGNLKVTEMEIENAENHLVVIQPDGTLAKRMVASLPSSEDTTRTLQSDLLVTSALCNCGNLPPAMIQSLLDNGYSLKDLIDFGVPAADILASGYTIEDLLNNDLSPIGLFNAGVPINSLYGQTYEGGLIFYLDTLNVHPSFEGLVSAPYDQSTAAPWGSYGYDIYDDNGSLPDGGAMGIAIGTGLSNTTDIINTDYGSIDDAPYICDELYLNGFADWFLPSKDELNEMNQNIGHEASFPNVNIGGFQLASYLSSTGEDIFNAWAHNFFDNVQSIESKNYSIHVRAIRAF